LFMPLRLAITGQNAGPDMGRLLPYIGYGRVINRLKGQQD
jgi:glutamyl-tRNA synthetase